MAALRVDGIASVPLPAFPGGAGPASSPLLDAAGARADGRCAEEFRRTFMQVGVCAGVAGSAYVELGRTKVMAAVHGPRDGGGGGGGDLTRGRLAVEFRAAPWCAAGSSRGGPAGEAGREAAALVAAALEPAILFEAFPKSLLTLAIHVLDGDGGEAGAAVMAGSLALADAGVPTRDLVAAAGVARVVGPGGASSGALVLDPTAAEGAGAAAGALVALMPATDRVTQAVFTGGWGPDAVEGGVGLASAGAAGLGEAMRAALRGGER